jgi:hypothetical protein
VLTIKKKIGGRKMSKLWDQPLYNLKDDNNKLVTIDVTSLVNPGLPPNEIINKEIIPFFRKKGVENIVDFGTGALRHVFPFLRKSFQIYAVEFEEQFKKSYCAEELKKARRNPNFSTLIYPKDFKNDGRKFDAALLCFVLQIMPLHKERELVLDLLYKKLTQDAYLFYMSRYNQMHGISQSHRVEDSYYKWP